MQECASCQVSLGMPERAGGLFPLNLFSNQEVNERRSKEMIELLSKLAKARQLEELTNLARKQAMLYFESSPFYMALVNNSADATLVVTVLTDELRKEAEVTFAHDGEKKPEHGGYEIKNSTVVEMTDDAGLREWLFNNFRPALKTDVKMVEKAAKDGNIPAQFVAVKEVPKVYIKTDLSKFIE